MLEGPAGSPSPGAARSPDTPALRYSVGDSLGDRYTIIEEIGAGGMGVVYKAIDRQLGKPVALKLMRTKSVDPASVARFRRELTLAQQVSHPNVCRLHDLGESKGVLYISMEFVDGQRLDDSIVSMGHLSPRQAIALGRQLCAGLAAVHEQGIVHRDLKPSNIMVGRSGHIFIMDFGLATRHGGADRVTSTGAVLGTFAYLSPEQARGANVDTRSDIYALGLILYEMLTGRIPPGDGVTLPLALRDAAERCPPPSLHVADIPPVLDAIVMRCLERDVSKRFASASEVDQALAQIQMTSATTTVRNKAFSGRLWPENRRTRIATAASAALAAIIATVLGVNVSRKTPISDAGRSPVVAVLPLTNVSGDSKLDSLGVGVADVLITRLAAAPRVTIVSAGSTLGYQSAQNTRAIARELGASYVVAGSIQARGGQMRLTLKLLRPDDSVAWGHDYDSSADGLFELQGRIAEGVASALDLTLTDMERQRLVKPPTADLRAFAEYSQGKALLEKGGTSESIPFLESAIHHDPKFALAHAALGQAYWKQFRDTKETAWMTKATQSVLEALRLEADQPQVRISLAEIYKGTGRRDDALEEARNVIRQRPSNDDAFGLAGRILAEQGKTDEAVHDLKQAIELRPNYWNHHFQLGRVLYNAGRYQEAASALRAACDLQPDNYRGFQGLGTAYLALGDMERALQSYMQANRLSPDAATYSNIGTIYFWRGDYSAAESAYRQAIAIRPGDPNFHGNLGDAQRHQSSAEAQDSYRRAVKLAQDLLAVNPNEADLMAFAANCQARLGDLKGAITSIEKALSIAADSPEVQYYAAAVYAASHRTTDAMASLERALSLGYSVVFVEHSDDLAPLAGLPAFRELLERTKSDKLNRPSARR